MKNNFIFLSVFNLSVPVFRMRNINKRNLWLEHELVDGEVIIKSYEVSTAVKLKMLCI